MSKKHWTEYASDTIKKTAQSVADSYREASETHPVATAFAEKQARDYVMSAAANAFGNAFNEFFGGDGNGMRDEGPVYGPLPWNWNLPPDNNENDMIVWQNNY